MAEVKGNCTDLSLSLSLQPLNYIILKTYPVNSKSQDVCNYCTITNYFTIVNTCHVPRIQRKHDGGTSQPGRHLKPNPLVFLTTFQHVKNIGASIPRTGDIYIFLDVTKLPLPVILGNPNSSQHIFSKFSFPPQQKIYQIKKRRFFFQ